MCSRVRTDTHTLINRLHQPVSIKKIPGKEEQVKLHQKEAIARIQNVGQSTIQVNPFKTKLKMGEVRGKGRGHFILRGTQ